MPDTPETPDKIMRRSQMPDTFRENEFKGKPTVSILTRVGRDGEEYWFSFGLSKAKAILEHVGEIENWVIEQEEAHRR